MEKQITFWLLMSFIGLISNIYFEEKNWHILWGPLIIAHVLMVGTKILEAITRAT